jgi:hypothetical protein
LADIAFVRSFLVALCSTLRAGCATTCVVAHSTLGSCANAFLPSATTEALKAVYRMRQSGWASASARSVDVLPAPAKATTLTTEPGAKSASTTAACSRVRRRPGGGGSRHASTTGCVWLRRSAASECAVASLTHTGALISAVSAYRNSFALARSSGSDSGRASSQRAMARA